ncbi:hypothetical protein [Sandaracinus amylolyticus]|uniref:hypothetical protein n=1 Tax=Sandaracinus amylolyticus TaxID=927083 RepID=UPI001F2DCAE3|nr:hypothetical protein [Sandaracinus amylolyticus]UJR84602.1 Hypothetical protein I5071_66810 [Sandaracinus amylolyticus]
MLRLSQSVPLLAITSALVSGCYLDHGADGPTPRDAGTVDARTTPIGPDASLLWDAGSAPDAGLTCAPTRADFVCLESIVVPAATPFTLPLAFDTCGCCAQTECAVVDVTRDSRTVRLVTTLCPDPCDCDACNTPIAQCEIPGLPAGEWLVEVNGAPAMVLPVASPHHTNGRTCVDFAEDDECTRGREVLEGRPMRPSRACVRRGFGGESHDELDLVEECGTCDRESTCEVRVVPRLTDDLPPGSDLHVTANRYLGACDGVCPPVCIENTRTCPLPSLPPGDVNRVFVDGEPILTFTSGESEVVCSD